MLDQRKGQKHSQLNSYMPTLHITRSLARFQDFGIGTPVLELIWLTTKCVVDPWGVYKKG